MEPPPTSQTLPSEGLPSQIVIAFTVTADEGKTGFDKGTISCRGRNSTTWSRNTYDGEIILHVPWLAATPAGLSDKAWRLGKPPANQSGKTTGTWKSGCRAKRGSRVFWHGKWAVSKEGAT